MWVPLSCQSTTWGYGNTNKIENFPIFPKILLHANQVLFGFSFLNTSASIILQAMSLCPDKSQHWKYDLWQISCFCYFGSYQYIYTWKKNVGLGWLRLFWIFEFRMFFKTAEPCTRIKFRYSEIFEIEATEDPLRQAS